MKQLLLRGCLEFLLVWGLFAAVSYSTFGAGLRPPAHLWGPICSGFLLSLAWGSVRNGYHSLKRAKLIGGSASGLPPRDGELYAAAGTIKALKEPLLSPFRGVPAVVLGYELFRRRTFSTGVGSSRRTHTVKDTVFSGFAMAPCAIQTKTRLIPLVGFPMPDLFPEDEFPAVESRAAVHDFASRTQFVELGKDEVGRLFDRMKGLLTEADGEMREDHRFIHHQELLENNFESLLCSEQVVPVGAEACAVGLYSSLKGGLVQDFATGGLELIPGNIRKAAAQMRTRAFTQFFLALFLALMGTIGTYLVVNRREAFLEAKEASRLSKQLSTTLS